MDTQLSLSVDPTYRLTAVVRATNSHSFITIPIQHNHWPVPFENGGTLKNLIHDVETLALRPIILIVRLFHLRPMRWGPLGPVGPITKRADARVNRSGLA